MQDFTQWIVDNWQFVSGIAATCCSLILLLIFRNKKIITYIDEYYGDLVDLIKEAESIFGAGRGCDKSKYVLTRFLISHPKVTPEAAKTAIEDILATPQKKGGK